MKSIVVDTTITSKVSDNACSLLAQSGKLSKSQIKRAMIHGAVWLHRPGRKRRRLRRASYSPLPGDRLVLYYDESILNRRAPEARCIADHQRYSIWFKPAGRMTQGTKFGDHCSLQYQVERHFKPPRKVYLVHRLDREAAGLIILAHDSTSARLFSRMLRHHKIEKCYTVIVRGDLARIGVSGRIDRQLDGKQAMTDYRMTHYDPAKDESTVDVRIVTGRKHQIRRHFDMVGFPVMGDPRYGVGNKNNQGLQLTASGLAFECPFSKNPVHIADPGHP